MTDLGVGLLLALSIGLMGGSAAAIILAGLASFFKH